MSAQHLLSLPTLCAVTLRRLLGEQKKGIIEKAGTSQENLLSQPGNPVALCQNISFPGIISGDIHSLMSHELSQSLAHPVCPQPRVEE